MDNLSADERLNAGFLSSHATGSRGPRPGKEPIDNEENEFYDDDDDLRASGTDNPSKKKQKPKRRARNMRDRANDEKWVGNR
mmetsp:Transcript_1136/g.3188  ORF Transcript_1136/g.3188 Transcript_1136/m.3188 type:complete len:82 (+) Transcript_1136:2235-2480(+)